VEEKGDPIKNASVPRLDRPSNSYHHRPWINHSGWLVYRVSLLGSPSHLFSSIVTPIIATSIEEGPNP